MRFLTRAIVALAMSLPLACTAADEPAKYQLGQHYKMVRTPQTPADPNKIQVMEVFAYSCPHCFQFEPHVEKWLKSKPADVEFVQLPHTLGAKAGVPRNKAFYAAQKLGVFDKFHRTLFGAIHGQGKMMATPEDMRALFVEQLGVPAEDFEGAFTGFDTDNRFRRGEQAIAEMGIASVPTIVVDGRYYTSPRAGGGFGEMLAVTDFLVQKARQERQSR
jgi:thiol:disulfide interchange protein DsbA